MKYICIYMYICEKYINLPWRLGLVVSSSLAEL
jgi:hypothetical protein